MATNRFADNFLILCFCAALLPTAAIYFSAGILCLYHLYRWRSQRQVDGDQAQRPSAECVSLRRGYYAAWPLAAGMLLAALLSAFMVEGQDVGRLVKYSYHIAAKSVVWPAAWLFILSRSFASGFRIQQLAAPYALFSGLYLLYALTQRYTGVDWVHGFTAYLPAHRFAYDVYRVSGFMGHPLSLAYNTAIMTLTLWFCLRLRWTSAPSRERRHWIAGVLFTLSIHVLTASRWPSAILLFSVMAFEGMRAIRYWRFIGIGAVVLASAIWLEGSMIGRMQEILRPDVPIEQREARWVFWKIHWEMFQDAPITGIGVGQQKSLVMDYYARGGYTDIERKYSAHNIYLQTLADTGIVGFVGLVGLYAVLISVALRFQGMSRRTMMVLIGASVGFGLMQDTLRDTEFLYAFWMAMLLLLVRAAYAGPTEPSVGSHGKPPQDNEPGSNRPHFA